MRNKLILGTSLALLLAVTSVSLASASGDAKGDNNGDRCASPMRPCSTAARTPTSTSARPGRASATGSSSPATWSVTTGGSAWAAATASPCCFGRAQIQRANRRLSPASASPRCRCPRGQITAQGLADRIGPVPITLAITGGTGAYRTAHGELQTSGPNQQGDEPLTLQLIL